MLFSKVDTNICKFLISCSIGNHNRPTTYLGIAYDNGCLPLLPLSGTSKLSYPWHPRAQVKKLDKLKAVYPPLDQQQDCIKENETDKLSTWSFQSTPKFHFQFLQTYFPHPQTSILQLSESPWLEPDSRPLHYYTSSSVALYGPKMSGTMK